MGQKTNQKTAARSSSEMPGGNKYTVQTTNRFMLADSSASESGSEDETSNLDPFSMIQQATTAAIKKTKEDLKNAHKKPAVVKKSEPEEEKKDEKPKGNNRNRNNNNRGNREPRGNQQQRRGPRNERKPKDGAADGENNQVGQKGGDAPLGDNNRQRRERRPRDRASGDPRTGVKAQEKRGGAGKGNWGKADKNYDDEEKPTPEAGTEEKPIEKSADGEAAPEEQENQEPEEPAGPAPISLEEYMASLGVSEAPKNLRKANDGQDIIKGAFRSDKIHKENLTSFKPVERTNNKEYIPAENLSFVSRADKGGFYYTDNRRDNNRGDRRERGGNRGGNKGGQPKEFNLKAMKEEAFPSLGGKVAAK